jgi:hypothetical protein
MLHGIETQFEITDSNSGFGFCIFYCHKSGNDRFIIKLDMDLLMTTPQVGGVESQVTRDGKSAAVKEKVRV